MSNLTLSDSMGNTNPDFMDSLTIIQPDDWHLHVRDGEVLNSVIGHTIKQFARAIIMPNLLSPVVSVDLASEYMFRINEAIKLHDMNSSFIPLMTLYLTDNTSVDEIHKACESGIVHGLKLYPAGATTNSDAGVTDLLANCSAVLEAMQRNGLALLVHGEVTDPNVDIFDREAVFIDRIMIPLRKSFPDLKVVFEHLTTKNGVDYVMSDTGPTAATITAHHLLYNRNAIFNGGLRPHYYCLPVLKREQHRQALINAATSDSDRFFLGTDSAPHLINAKQSDCGCAGCYTAFHAMELYAQAFDAVGKINKLEAFASINGAKFYGLPVNTSEITLKRQKQTIPQHINIGNNDLIVPLDAGRQIEWTLV